MFSQKNSVILILLFITPCFGMDTEQEMRELDTLYTAMRNQRPIPNFLGVIPRELWNLLKEWVRQNKRASRDVQLFWGAEDQKAHSLLQSPSFNITSDCCKLSPDGSTYCIGSNNDGPGISVYDAKTHQLRRFICLPHVMSSFDYYPPDNTQIVVRLHVDKETEIRFINIHTGRTAKTIDASNCNKFRGRFCLLKSGRILVGHREGVAMYHPDRPDITVQLYPHSKDAYCWPIPNNDETLFAAFLRNTAGDFIQIWDTNTGQMVKEFSWAHDRYSLPNDCFDLDNSLLLEKFLPQKKAFTLERYNTKTWELMAAHKAEGIEGDENILPYYRMSYYAKLAAIKAANHSILLLNIDPKQPSTSSTIPFNGNEERPTDFRFNEQGTLLVVATTKAPHLAMRPHMIYLYDPLTRQPIVKIPLNLGSGPTMNLKKVSRSNTLILLQLDQGHHQILSLFHPQLQKFFRSRNYRHNPQLEDLLKKLRTAKQSCTDPDSKLACSLTPDERGLATQFPRCLQETLGLLEKKNNDS